MKGPASDRSKLVLRMLVLAGAYFLGAKLGLTLAFANRNVTTVWPPTGIAVALLLIWGNRLWPGIAVGAFLANLSNGAGPLAAAAITVGNTLAPFVAAYALRTVFGLRDTLDRLRDVLALLAFGGFVCMTISATGGALALRFTGGLGDSTLASVWLVWWVGDAIGVVLFAPFLLMLSHYRRENPLLSRPVEAAGLVALTAIATAGVFSLRVMVAYALFVLVAWSAVRFETAGAATITVVIAIIAVWRTATGHGPFSFLSPTENLVSLQAFNAVVAFTSLVLASIMRERRAAERAVRSSAEEYRMLFERANDFVCTHTLDGKLTSVNAAGGRITGYSDAELAAMRIEDLVDGDSMRVIRRMIDRKISGETKSTLYEIDLLTRDGRRVPLEVNTSLVYVSGKPSGVQLIGRDITRRKRAEEELRHQALHDALTGLPNRVLLRERLDYALMLAEREQTQVALLVMDFDGFKEVNDTLGHPSGDILLKKIAQRLRSSLRGSDTIARLGGDEFAVLITSFSEEKGAVMVAEKIRTALYAPFEVAGENILISASIGIALYPQHGLDADTLTKLADVAMYAAKKRGGGYAVYGSDAPVGLPDDSRR